MVKNLSRKDVKGIHQSREIRSLERSFRDCSYQLSQRIAIVENILLKYYGADVLAKGESIIDLLNRNWKDVNSGVRRTRNSGNKYVLPEYDNLVKLEQNDEYDDVDNLATCEKSFQNDTDEDFMPPTPQPITDSDCDDDENGSPQHKFHLSSNYKCDNENDYVSTELARRSAIERNRRRVAKLEKIRSRIVDGQKTTTTEKRFKCVKCDMQLRNARNLRLHLVLHRSDHKYKCEICNEGFRTEFLKNLHARVHAEHRPYKCEHCPLSFANTSRLRQHSVYHDPEGKHDCNTCGKKFKVKSALTRHVMGHERTKPYPCPKCEQRFFTASHTRRHLKTVHKCFENVDIKKDPAYIKPKAERTQRLRTVSQKPKKDCKPDIIICYMCGASISRKGFKAHLRTHSSPYKCSYCEKEFATEYAMNFHTDQVHIDPMRPFTCKFLGCDARFKLSSTLRHHKITHTSIPRFHCDACDKGYKHKSGLRLHNQIYHSDTPIRFPCPQCSNEKSFHTSSHLNRHLRTVHGSRFSGNIEVEAVGNINMETLPDQLLILPNSEENIDFDDDKTTTDFSHCQY